MTAATLEVHRLSREIPGAPGVLLPLPLCWDMEARQRFGADHVGTDVCGLCLHRHNRAAHKDVNPTTTKEPR